MFRSRARRPRLRPRRRIASRRARPPDRRHADARGAVPRTRAGGGERPRSDHLRARRRPRLCPPRRAALKGTERQTYRVAFFGDSLSVGFGASCPRRTYVARVTRWLRMHGKRVVQTVHAEGGAPVAYWQQVRMPRQLDAAVIELGTNGVRLRMPAAQFAHEYRTLTNRIHAATPNVQL